MILKKMNQERDLTAIPVEIVEADRLALAMSDPENRDPGIEVIDRQEVIDQGILIILERLISILMISIF